jgi:hypothetical protein
MKIEYWVKNAVYKNISRIMHNYDIKYMKEKNIPKC